MTWNRIQRKIAWWLNKNRAKQSYSQCGEDLIVNAIFNALEIKQPAYVDIGAYDAREMSNTFLFYSRGGKGVCVEPNPSRFNRIRHARPRDLCLNVGVGPQTRAAMPFYILSQEALSTFSEEEARRVCAYGGNRIKQTVHIPVFALNDLIRDEHLAPPDFLSMDLEGNELLTLQSLDFKQWRPKVLCVETLTYTEDKTEQKQTSTIEWLKNQGYMGYGDTYINSIFVDQACWKNRP